MFGRANGNTKTKESQTSIHPRWQNMRLISIDANKQKSKQKQRANVGVKRNERQNKNNIHVE